MNVLDDTLDRTRSAPMTVAEWPMTGNPPANPGSPAVEVTEERSQDAALRFRSKKVGVLNFASAKNPGGGVRRGANAQEEDLCRCSGLLHTLEKMGHFYSRNRAKDTPRVYHHQMLVSGNVPIVRDGEGNLVDPFFVTFFTCAAPNMNCGITSRDARKAFRFRMAEIVSCAANLGVEVLVLGAWGCGVFRNDPEMVASEWKAAVAQYSGGIERVIHPVYRNRINFEVFQVVLGG